MVMCKTESNSYQFTAHKLVGAVVWLKNPLGQCSVAVLYSLSPAPALQCCYF